MIQIMIVVKKDWVRVVQIVHEEEEDQMIIVIMMKMIKKDNIITEVLEMIN